MEAYFIWIWKFKMTKICYFLLLILVLLKTLSLVKVAFNFVKRHNALIFAKQNLQQQVRTFVCWRVPFLSYGIWPRNSTATRHGSASTNGLIAFSHIQKEWKMKDQLTPICLFSYTWGSVLWWPYSIDTGRQHPLTSCTQSFECYCATVPHSDATYSHCTVIKYKF